MFQGRDFKPSIFGVEANAAKKKMPVGYAVDRTQAIAGNFPKGFHLGYAELAVHDYVMSKDMVYTINYGLHNLVRSHERVFHRKVDQRFRVRIRIFGKYADYERYSQVRYRKKVTKNLLGFFSAATKEIVTWRQQPHLSWRLVPTILHEGCHAIMDNIIGELPFWMIEGSADWLGEAPAWLQKADGLRRDQLERWIRMEDLLKKKKLPPLKNYLLTTSYDEWDRMFDGNIGQGYDVGWSIFDFFMRASPDGKAMKFLGAVMSDRAVTNAPRRNGGLEKAFVATVDRNWHGHLPMLERGWHTWIRQEAARAHKKLAVERAKVANP